VLQYIISVLTIGAIVGILSLGLNVRWGWVGDLDLAYYLFVAMGAYVGGALQAGPSQNLGDGSGWILGMTLPFPVALLIGGAVGAASAAIVGGIALFRLRGDYFAITTLAFTLIAVEFLSQNRNIFDGFNGVYGIPQPFESQLNLSQDDYQWFFLGLCCVLLIIVYLILNLLYHSAFGRTLRAVREDEIAAAAFGRNVYSLKLKAYVIGGACAGLGGVLFAAYLSTWNPTVWAPAETFLLYAGIFLGGQANSKGVVIGTIIVVVAIPEATRFLPEIPGHGDLFPALHLVFVGIVLIAVLRFRPQGLLPEPRSRDRDNRWRRKPPPPIVEAVNG
jgi:ABC-type branched-subunit amino acid transport system permease subunit